MRKLGVGFLGLLVGFLTPALAVGGAVVALVIDSRRFRRLRKDTP